MKTVHSSWISFGIFIVAFCIGCSPKKSTSTNTLTDPDTRNWVKAAFAKVDPMKITATFNLERANIIKAQLDAEQDPERRLNLSMVYAGELLKIGAIQESITSFENILKYIQDNQIEIDPNSKQLLLSMTGIAYMRQGEIDNCLQNHNHQSCIIPIAGGGIHQLPTGSRGAIRTYEMLLKEFPKDLETKYLLNLAYMTLGEYPNKVPAAWQIDPSWFTSNIKIQPFQDIAPQLGVNRKSLAGGVVVDDFTNDGWLDIVVTSWSPKEGMVFYVNNGDGTFTDQTSAYGLDGQVGILNLNQTDFNNDGWLDLYLMRGAWYADQGDIPNTLLMNTGKGGFVDATLKANMTHFAATQASAWADFNLDGWVDLVIGNESGPGYERGIDLYINQKNGTFKHESERYGLTLNHFFKGCVAVDVNNDRYPDILLSSRKEGNSLFINQGAQGKEGFVDMAQQLQLVQPEKAFPCWNFDFDNDGNEDLLISSYYLEGPPAMHWMLGKMGKAEAAFLPRLYRNKGNMQFEDVGVQMGLDESVFTMGCDFGDINTDGFLDFYMATGNPFYQSLVPNIMYLNMDGKRFEDVSYSGGFANIQKGHGVAFGDVDHDGDEDIYEVVGGAYDGDAFYNTLFENPNQDKNNWVILKLIGQTANKAAIGARVTIYAIENGQERKICRTVTSGASFGGNSLVLEVGLRKATSIKNVTIQWPCKDCPIQEFTGLEINMAYDLTQDSKNPKMVDYDAVKFGAGKSMEHHMHH